MPVSHSRIQTERASIYLQQLCKHWSHKLTVSFTPENGKIAFSDDTHVELIAHNNVLEMALHTPNGKRQETLEKVVADHLARFAFRENPSISWQRQPS
jgi:uncharacterized protein